MWSIGNIAFSGDIYRHADAVELLIQYIPFPMKVYVASMISSHQVIDGYT